MAGINLNPLKEERGSLESLESQRRQKVCPPRYLLCFPILLSFFFFFPVLLPYIVERRFDHGCE